MSAPFGVASPGRDQTARSAGPTEAPDALTIVKRSGRFSAPPELGTEVKFQRSPTHHPETGFVRARQFGTGIIEIVDMRGKLLRLDRTQYEVAKTPDPTHGRPAPRAPVSAAARGEPRQTFICPEWPGCDCPEGTMRRDCPGLKTDRCQDG